MALIYQVKMQQYAYLTIYPRMHGSIEENRKAIVNLHLPKMKRERIKTIKGRIRINKERGNHQILDLSCILYSQNIQ